MNSNLILVARQPCAPLMYKQREIFDHKGYILLWTLLTTVDSLPQKCQVSYVSPRRSVFVSLDMNWMLCCYKASRLIWYSYITLKSKSCRDAVQVEGDLWTVDNVFNCRQFDCSRTETHLLLPRRFTLLGRSAIRLKARNKQLLSTLCMRYPAAHSDSCFYRTHFECSWKVWQSVMWYSCESSVFWKGTGVRTEYVYTSLNNYTSNTTCLTQV